MKLLRIMSFKDNVNHIFGWFNGFKRVEMSTEAQPCSHCLFMSKTDENVKKVSAVHEVCCLTIEEMAEMTRVIEFMSMYLKEDLIVTTKFIHGYPTFSWSKNRDAWMCLWWSAGRSLKSYWVSRKRCNR